MRIIKYKKMSKGRYKITFDTTELILYEDVIIENNLLMQKNLSLELLEKVLEQNKYYEIYNLSLSYIEIKLRTKQELKEYLMKKLFSESLINEVINRLENDGYINEEKYISAYVNDRVNLSNKGPFKIKRELLDLGLSENLIDNYLNTISFDVWKSKLSNIINKRVSVMKNKSLYMIKNKLKIDLFNLGYQSELIDELLTNVNKNDCEVLKKEFIKCYNKYAKKYNGIMLCNKVKSYLYSKGYNLEDINDIMSGNNL